MRYRPRLGRPSQVLTLSAACTAACLALWLSACDGPAASSAVARVGIDQPPQTLAVGETFTFTATVEAINGASTTVAWSSSATGIAPIAVGEVAALAPGVATITARSTVEPRHSDRVDVTVTAASDGFACAEPVTASTTASAHGLLLVRYRDDRSADGAVRTQASSAGAGIAVAAGGAQVRRGAAGEPDLLRVPVAAVEPTLAALRALPEVAHAVPDVPVRRATVTDDPFYDLHQWNLSGFGADAAWARIDASARPDTDVVVAVIDNGVAVDHPDLRAAVLPGWDAFHLDVDPRNCVDHGTHVAGIAVAARGDGAGIAGVGSAPWVRLLPVKAWPDTTESDALTSLSAVERAMRWAAGLPVADAPHNPHRADVMNLSLAIEPAYVDAAMAAYLGELVAEIQAAGVTVVAAAGNGGTGTGVAYPARAGAIAVGSVDADHRRSDFSAYGAGLTLVAPGGAGPGCGSVLSSSLVYEVGHHAVKHAYACMAGTSMAAPYVAGAVALLIGSDASLRDRPEAIAERLAAAAGRRPGPNSAEYGAGILCLDALLADGVCGER